MAKIIMPMERPATVSVIQVEGEPTKGNAASASAMGKSAGMKSMRCFGSATPESMAVIKLVQAEGGHFPGAAKRHTGSRAKASAPGPGSRSAALHTSGDVGLRDAIQGH